jgi:Uncharacterized proteins of the AP superfamily
MKLRRSTHKINWVLFGILGLVFLAIGALTWAFGLMDSAQNYRSPLANLSPTPGQILGSPVTRRVVVVLIDALRYDTSINTTIMPFLNNLRTLGASATMHSQPPSFSAPGWATILTGAWPYINDSQLFNPPDPHSARPFTQDDIFADAQRAGLNTAVSGYAWFQGLLANSGVDMGFYTVGEDKAADSDVVNAALPWLKEDYQLVLIHIDQVDFAGHHEGGPKSPNWNAAATRSDDLLRNIVSNLDLAQDTLMVISDHGQIDRGGHGGPDPVTLIEPFVLAGKGVVPGSYGNVNMTDIAPTLAALLGTSIPASNQGHVLLDMLTLSSERNVSIQKALIIQQTQLLKVYTKAIGSSVNVGDGEIVSATETALKKAIQARLSSERIWRNMLAAFLAILPGYIFFVRKDRKALWLMAGAILYVVLFNLRYAIIDGRTYSLASIEGANWLIIYTGTTTFVAVLIAWLVPMLGLRTFADGSHKTIVTTLGYIWFIMYLLALPILLNFAINGLSVTWTLPEWNTMFIGLLSLIQWLFVALAGLFLTGILAVQAQLTRKHA